jgi:UDP-N-acetylmuramoyl-tripeptide--D-alanyl-D-alanine ligase
VSFTAWDLHEWLDRAHVPHRLLQADGAPWSTEGGLARIALDGAVVDSRDAGPGLLFAAVAGENRHGAEFLVAALEAGSPVALVEERLPDVAGRQEPVFLVEDARPALAALARGWLDDHAPRVLAVTGSNGKTTTKDMALAGLSGRRIGANPGNWNSGYGLPLAVLAQGDAVDLLLLEMGASAPGEIARLAALVEPEVGCVTNVAPAHLEGFGSVDEVLRTKGALLAALPETGCAILPVDDVRYDRLAALARPTRRLRFGRAAAAEVRLEACVQGADGLRVRIAGVETLLPLFGEANALNAAAACALALAVDEPVEASLPRMAAATLSPHRSRLAVVEGRVILDDCYNANPASMAQALVSLAHLPVQGRRVAVLGRMAELGEMAPTLHAQIVGQARGLGLDEILPVGAEMRAAAGLDPTEEEDLESLGRGLARRLRPGDAVLLKGSRSVGLERALDALVAGLQGAGGGV